MSCRVHEIVLQASTLIHDNRHLIFGILSATVFKAKWVEPNKINIISPLRLIFFVQDCTFSAARNGKRTMEDPS